MTSRIIIALASLALAPLAFAQFPFNPPVDAPANADLEVKATLDSKADVPLKQIDPAYAGTLELSATNGAAVYPLNPLPVLELDTPLVVNPHVPVVVEVSAPDPSAGVDLGQPAPEEEPEEEAVEEENDNGSDNDNSSHSNKPKKKKSVSRKRTVVQEAPDPEPTKTPRTYAPPVAAVAVIKPNESDLYWQKDGDRALASFGYEGLDQNYRDSYTFSVQLLKGGQVLGDLGLGSASKLDPDQDFASFVYQIGAYVDPRDGQFHAAPDGSDYAFRVSILRAGVVVATDESDSTFTIVSNPNFLQRIGFAVRAWFGFGNTVKDEDVVEKK